MDNYTYIDMFFLIYKIKSVPTQKEEKSEPIHKEEINPDIHKEEINPDIHKEESKLVLKEKIEKKDVRRKFSVSKVICELVMCAVVLAIGVIFGIMLIIFVYVYT